MGGQKIDAVYMIFYCSRDKLWNNILNNLHLSLSFRCTFNFALWFLKIQEFLSDISKFRFMILKNIRTSFRYFKIYSKNIMCILQSSWTCFYYILAVIIKFVPKGIVRLEITNLLHARLRISTRIFSRANTSERKWINVV